MNSPTSIDPLDVKPPVISRHFRDLPPPLIIIGMHRSGTSLVAGMLTALGVCLDPAMRPPAEGIRLALPGERARREGYGEAHVFRLLNESILAHAGATWDDVDPFLERRDRPAFARMSVAQMQLATFRSLRGQYLDLLPEANRGAWGWKDPRNSLTLPYWLQLFPAARILHVRRDPEKVAKSMVHRAEAWASAPAASPCVGSRLQHAICHPDAALRSLSRRAGILPAARSASSTLLDRERSLRLCEQYVQECSRFSALGAQYLEVQFEDILADPVDAAFRLAHFAAIRPSWIRLQQGADFVLQPPVPRASPARPQADCHPLGSGTTCSA